MKLPRLACFAVLTCAVLFFSACHHRSADGTDGSRERQPDLILIVVDALRRDHLGMYGYDKPTSPGMDSLAAEGIVFDNAYSHGSQTFNSTASLLTSRYFPYLLPRLASEPIEDLNPETGSRHARVPVLAESNVTLAEALRDGGYQTVGIFTNPHHHWSSGFWQGFEHARYLSAQKGDVAYARGPKIHSAFFNWYDTEREGRPYFAYLHFMDAHAPYRPPRFLRRKFVTVKGRDLYRKGVPVGDGVPTGADLQYMMALYDGEIRFVDLVVESLLHDLALRDGLDDAVLIITSDHGDEFMDHGGLGHGSHLERELIHVPLMISGLPNQPGRKADLTRHIDVAPTLLDLAGLDSPTEFEGASLLPLVHGSDQADLRIEESFAAVGNHRSLTTRDWHFTFTPKEDRTRLYRLDSDPRGLQDLSERHPDLVADFLAQLEQLEGIRVRTAQQALELAGERPSSDQNRVGPEIRQQLEALGYVDP
ncbi:MAG: sulfatase [Thermoanaerobaculia bacterium]